MAATDFTSANIGDAVMINSYQLDIELFNYY
jgi:tRNA C32,U32 (ribose-2'-O)-methylase TrmJ